MRQPAQSLYKPNEEITDLISTLADPHKKQGWNLEALRERFTQLREHKLGNSPYAEVARAFYHDLLTASKWMMVQTNNDLVRVQAAYVSALVVGSAYHQNLGRELIGEAVDAYLENTEQIRFQYIGHFDGSYDSISEVERMGMRNLCVLEALVAPFVPVEYEAARQMNEIARHDYKMLAIIDPPNFPEFVATTIKLYPAPATQAFLACMYEDHFANLDVPPMNMASVQSWFMRELPPDHPIGQEAREIFMSNIELALQRDDAEQGMPIIEGTAQHLSQREWDAELGNKIKQMVEATKAARALQSEASQSSKQSSAEKMKKLVDLTIYARKTTTPTHQRPVRKLTLREQVPLMVALWSRVWQPK